MDVWNFLANGRSPSVVWQGVNKPVLLSSSSLSPLTEYQARERKEEEILAVLLSSSPSLPSSSFAWQRQETDDRGLWLSDHPWVGIF